MDVLITEYSLTYGAPPPRDMPWPLFQLLLQRANQNFARRLLATMHGVAWAIGKSFGGKQTGALDGMRREIESAAFPGQKAKGPVFALKQSKEEDGVCDVG